MTILVHFQGTHCCSLSPRRTPPPQSELPSLKEAVCPSGLLEEAVLGPADPGPTLPCAKPCRGWLGEDSHAWPCWRQGLGAATDLLAMSFLWSAGAWGAVLISATSPSFSSVQSYKTNAMRKGILFPQSDWYAGGEPLLGESKGEGAAGCLRGWGRRLPLPGWWTWCQREKEDKNTATFLPCYFIRAFHNAENGR